MKTLFVLALFSFAYTTSQDHSRELDALLEGVAEIAAPGVPGPLIVYGPKAFPIATGGRGDLVLPVVAATQLGRGRIVVFGHTGYLGEDALETADTGRLLANAVRFAANRRPDKARIAVRGGTALRRLLTEDGLDATMVADDSWQGTLDDYDVLCLASGPRGQDVEPLRRFVEGGGGLLFGGLGWGYLQLNPTKTLADHPGNHLLEGSGLGFGAGTLSRTSDEGFRVSGPPPRDCHAQRALDTLVEHADGDELAPATIAQACETLMLAARWLPNTDRTLLPTLSRLAAKHASQLVPTAQAPIRRTDGLARVLIAFQLHALESAKPRRTKAHPAAERFPGSVPDDAPRVRRTITVDTSVPGWHGTGLYAVPGRNVTLDVPDAAANMGRQKGLRLRIGAHRDELWAKDEWRRIPAISASRPIEEKTSQHASAFGGLIYLEVPANCTLGEVELRVQGAVLSPRFVLGETEPDEWLEEVRRHPAPWAELETRKVVLTVPSASVRELEDPTQLLEFWDAIMDAAAHLAALPAARVRPERFVADLQISAGYMHAGYPIMTHLDAAETMTDLARMRLGPWGLVHELGHNHQQGDWTFSGTGEVTNNLFALYIIDTLCEPEGGSRGHGSVDEPPSIADYIARGAPFDQWKSRPFLALQTYIQLQEAFGWDAFREVFAEYAQLPAALKPQNDDEKRDQWLVRFSRRVGKNLGPFFLAWGIPTSDGARQSIADLPEWMPAGFPP